jgi:hypothetical protein
VSDRSAGAPATTSRSRQSTRQRSNRIRRNTPSRILHARHGVVHGQWARKPHSHLALSKPWCRVSARAPMRGTADRSRVRPSRGRTRLADAPSSRRHPRDLALGEEDPAGSVHWYTRSLTAADLPAGTARVFTSTLRRCRERSRASAATTPRWKSPGSHKPRGGPSGGPNAPTPAPSLTPLPALRASRHQTPGQVTLVCP